MIRRSAFENVEGFRESLIAGEEPELCLRLRAAGWKIWRLDLEMTLHDAAILRWSQWWTRSRRTGHAYAEGAWLHGAPPERHWVRETRRAAVWGIALPIVSIVGAILVHPVFLFALLLYPLQMLRLALRSGSLHEDELAQAMLLVLGKIPEGLGVLKFWLSRLFTRPAAIMEYK